MNSTANISDLLESLKTITIEFHTIAEILENNPDHSQAKLAYTLVEYAMQVLVNDIISSTVPEMLSEDEVDLVCYAVDICNFIDDEEDYE